MSDAYCTQQDIVDAYGEDRLLLLADRAGDGAVDAAVVTAAIAQAGATTDTRLAKRGYALPLATVPDILKRINIDLAMYYMAANENLLSEMMTERKKDALADLDKIAAGKIELGLPLAEIPAGQDQPQGDPNAPQRVFTTQTLSDFTNGPFDESGC